MALTHLLYISYETYVLSQNDLREILEISIRNNERDDITGILCYTSGSFMQLIEGEAELILSLWGKLNCDPRHKNLQKLLHQEIPNRSFAQWSMAYHAVDPSDLPPRGFSSFLQTAGEPLAEKVQCKCAYDYLLSFKDSLL